MTPHQPHCSACGTLADTVQYASELELPEPGSDACVPASRLNVFSRAMLLEKSGVAPVWSGCFTPVVGVGVKWTMRERRLRQDALFYEFSLEDHVPEGHLLRSIDRFVELDGLRQNWRRSTVPLAGDRSIRN